MGGASKLLMLLSTPFPLLYRRPSALRLARHSRVPPASLSTAACAAPLSSHSRLPSSGPCQRPGFSVRAAEQIHTQTGVREGLGDLTGPLSDQRASHPWTEWSKLVDHLTAAGYSGRRISAAAGEDDDSFLAYEDLPREFARDAESCLSFARDRPDLLRLLSKKDIEVIVENGSPFLFKNGVNSARRIRLFLSGGETDVLEYERAQTVDVIRYLLSYACNPPVTSDKNSIKATEITEASVRNLLTELVKVSGTVRESNFTESIPRQPPLRHEQLSKPPGQNIEMKRGDWICPKCSFMNFARNIRCLECNEGKPKRQLTGGEWECPQCDFFNYGRNMSCLRCDCKRPGETPPIAGAPGTSSGFSRNPSFEQILNGGNTDKTEIERRLAANDEKAERWFSKVSQMNDASDLSQAAADEDFPEIMPLRKGENRFVVSTRKTPLERRLANAQYRSNLGNDDAAEESDRTTESSVTQSLDRILGRTSGINPQSVVGETNAAAGSRFNFSERKQSPANQRRDPEYVPFVPLPADMFSKSKTSDNDMQRSTGKDDSSSAKASQVGDSDSKVSDSPTESKIDKESSDASERWSKKVTELSNTADLASTISDEDFPEIMPMRKGENRFVVSKKKDRSLTSPQYKRRLALEQANNSNFVPFVPFPPDYFAKKDKQPEASPPAAQPENSSSLDQVHGVTEKHLETKPMESKAGAVENMSRRSDTWMASSRSTEFSGRNSNASKMDSVYGAPTANPAPEPGNSWNNKDGWNSGASQRSSGAFSGGSATCASQPVLQSPQNAGESWKFSGKSLEGSAVKEPDPLDMSEEAKAERWFRRVAQIKDISELSQIPDEDFPEIMPMRKGVNRFVVSKRKTPLERRLTSPQYRRNLPIVSSDPEKDASS